jgi:hypothetical protein
MWYRLRPGAFGELCQPIEDVDPSHKGDVLGIGSMRGRFKAASMPLNTATWVTWDTIVGEWQ